MPGSIGRNLKASTLADVAKRWALLDPVQVNSTAATFQAQYKHSDETPVELRSTMDKLVEAFIQLRVQLQTLSEEAEDHLFKDFADTGEGELMRRFPALLDRLKLAAVRGHEAEVGRDGRSRSRARHELIVGLAKQLDRAGYAVDARPQGDLCTLVDIVLEDLKARPANVRSTVRDALARMASGEYLSPD